MRKPAQKPSLIGGDDRASLEPRSGTGSSAEAGLADAPRDADADAASARSASLSPASRPDGQPPDFDEQAVGDADEQGLSDTWLVERARHGDHAAFAVLVRRYERKLIRVLTRMVRDPELARDLSQETLWRVYLRLERFDSARRFGPWLFRVGVNLSLDWLRSAKAETLAPASSPWRRRGRELPRELPDPDPRTKADLAQEVQHVLSQVPVSYRTILVLRDLEGFSTSEVAAIVGREEATIRWRLAVAREKFRQIWQRRLQESDSEPAVRQIK